jgi:hypothetical protein
MVTVAPTPFADGGISIPPPSAMTPAAPVLGIEMELERATPPEIVTPSMDTVGSVGALYLPMVRTLSPPLMMVERASVPTIPTLTSTVTPPLKVPRPIWIVSPSWAASTAAWSVE